MNEAQPASPGNNEEAATTHHKLRNKLSSDNKLQVLLFLLNRAKEGKLQYGSMKLAAIQFNVATKTVSRIWNTAEHFTETMLRWSVEGKLHLCGRKRIQIQSSDITKLSMGQRSCIRDLATLIGVSKSKIHRMVQRGLIRPHTNPLHPGLKEANKLTRLEWILKLLMGDNLLTKRKYFPMYDFVHLDEKWFYLSNKSQRVYLAKNEESQYRAASSSKFIPKVMFTAVVGRPRYNEEDQCTFDGKIGIFPFTYQETAKRSSKNRARGTMDTKVVESVNQRVTRTMLIEQIVPDIIAKWPQYDGGPKTIYIQQDNAKAHISQEDPQWQTVCEQDGFTIILIQQPPNSPDLNILDLGFFRSIQSLMHKKIPKSIDSLLEAVNQAYNELDHTTLSNVWLSLQYVMNEILKVGGGNNYNVPHVNKKKLEKNGILEEQVTTPMWAVADAWERVVNGASSSNAQGE
ncbi:uncharacterized protein LOC104886291 [Beta vulgaris subsp. vulgaris]|uniref:uncharacterized protein LOC104886291 n=1 Tax=Beta vulgaris subsp. vulgaris TaxID=3555 RepID=UPI00053FF3FD|nr:uncharacterized protein LOC104886291 [Beta vulgaris subsp. vulgaris]